MAKEQIPDTLFSSVKVETDYADVPVFDTPNPEPLPAAVDFGAELPRSNAKVFAEKERVSELQPASETAAPPMKKLRERTQEKVESILNLRTFLLVAVTTALLAFYISNVISINRLSGETESLRKQLEDAHSLNVELESKLRALQRVEHVSAEAYKKLGLRYKTEPPIELSVEK
ncbi:MAG: hypothetical protein CMR00_03465 [[Chlorobium] sp. 445]|nr:MAG: hypothetical protein CMR00_03465 [[Chlorobium] sp. 445]